MLIWKDRKYTKRPWLAHFKHHNLFRKICRWNIFLQSWVRYTHLATEASSDRNFIYPLWSFTYCTKRKFVWRKVILRRSWNKIKTIKCYWWFPCRHPSIQFSNVRAVSFRLKKMFLMKDFNRIWFREMKFHLIDLAQGLIPRLNTIEVLN